MANCDPRGTLEYERGNSSHSFQVREFLKTLCAVCIGRVRRLLSAHSSTVTYISDVELNALASVDAARVNELA